MAKRKPRGWEAEHEALLALDDAAAADDGAARARVLAALDDEHGLLVSRAADIVRASALASSEVTGALLAAYTRLTVDAAKRDPGCRGKLAVLTALDELGHRDEQPFVDGCRYVQMEPGFPEASDSAGGVRSRSGAALARMHHPDTLLVLATLLADPLPPVRATAAETIAYHGDRSGAPLLMHKCCIGDEDPIVMLETMGALLDLAPHWGTPWLRVRLFGSDPEEQDLVRMMLGQHRSAAAIALLVEWFSESVLSAQKVKALEAIALHRSDVARDFLLARVQDGSAATARAAILGLSIHRYDTRLRDAVMAAAAKSRLKGLAAVVAQAFEE